MTSNFGSIRAANAYVAVNLRSGGIPGQLNQALSQMRNQINRAFPKAYGSAVRANFNFAQQGFASRMGSSALLGLDHGAAIRASKFGGGGSVISAGSITGGLLGADAIRGASVSLLKVIRLSRDYEETLNKFRMTFREFAGETERWAGRTAGSVQRSKTAFLEFSSQFQQFFVGFGFARRQAAEMSRTLTKLSVDIGSFYNVPDQEAARRLFQGLAGSTEALDIFGINAREARVKQQLGKTGVQFDKATAEQKVLARYNIILEATRDSQGDAFRTANSFANSLRGVASAATELGINLGLVLTRSDDLAKETKRQSGILAPYVVQIRDLTFGMARWVSENEDVVRSSFKTLGAIGALGVGLTGLQVGYGALSFLLSPAPFLALVSPITTVIDRLARLTAMALGAGAAIGGSLAGASRRVSLGGLSGSGFRFTPSGYAPGRFQDAMRSHFGSSSAPFMAAGGAGLYGFATGRSGRLLPGPVGGGLSTLGGSSSGGGPGTAVARPFFRQIAQAMTDLMVRRSWYRRPQIEGPSSTDLAARRPWFRQLQIDGPTQPQIDGPVGGGPRLLGGPRKKIDWWDPRKAARSGGAGVAGGVIEGRVIGGTTVITDIAKATILSRLWSSIAASVARAVNAGRGAVNVGRNSLLDAVGLFAGRGFDPRSRDGRAAAREEYRRRQQQDRQDARRLAARRRLGRMRFRAALSDPVGLIGSVGSSVVGAASNIAFGAVNTGVNVLSGSLSGLASIASLVTNGFIALGVAVLALPFIGMAYRALYLKAQLVDVKGTLADLKSGVVSFTQAAVTFGTGFVQQVKEVGEATGEFIKLGDMEGAITEVTGFLEESFLQAAATITQSFHSIFTSMKESLITVFDVMRQQLAPLKDLFDIQLGRDIVNKETDLAEKRKHLEDVQGIASDPILNKTLYNGRGAEYVKSVKGEVAQLEKELEKSKAAAVFFGAGAVPTQGADLAAKAEAGLTNLENNLAARTEDAKKRRIENRERLKAQQFARGGYLTDGGFSDPGGDFSTVPIPVTEGTGADAGKIGPTPDDERKAFSWWKVRQNLVNNLGLGTPAIASMLGNAIANEQNAPSFSNRSFAVSGDTRSASGTTTRAGTPRFRNSLDFSSLGGLVTTPKQVADIRDGLYRAASSSGVDEQGQIAIGNIWQGAANALNDGKDRTRGPMYRELRDSVIRSAVQPAFQAERLYNRVLGIGQGRFHSSDPQGQDVRVSQLQTASNIGRALLPGFKNLGKFIGGGGALGALQDAGAFEVLPGTIAKLGETVGRWQEMSGKQNQLTSELVSFGSFSGRAALYGVSASSDPSFQVQSRMLDELIRLREVAQAKKGVAI